MKTKHFKELVNSSLSLSLSLSLSSCLRFNLLLAAFCVVISFPNVSAQSHVFLTPEQANGYVAWYDNDTSGIEYWEAVVYERIPLTDSTYNEVRVWRHEEWRNNYIHIPSKYRPADLRNKYGVYLYGKDANNEVVIEEEIIPFLCTGCGGNFYFPGCYQICNGPDYAWKVQQ